MKKKLTDYHKSILIRNSNTLSNYLDEADEAIQTDLEQMQSTLTIVLENLEDKSDEIFQQSTEEDIELTFEIINEYLNGHIDKLKRNAISISKKGYDSYVANSVAEEIAGVFREHFREVKKNALLIRDFIQA